MTRSVPPVSEGAGTGLMVVRLQRWAYRVFFRVLQVWWFVARPQTNGVKLVLWSGDDVLFVRHTYGDRRGWELPGGGRKRDESPASAASREVREELGLDIERWSTIGEIVSRDHATATLVCLSGDHDGTPLMLSAVEIAEARWCAPADAPQPLGRHAAAVLDLPGFPRGTA